MIKRSIVSLSLIIILVGGYWVKKDSADGRLLIWNCAWEMIKDAPLTGHGSGSFRAHYMDYQAAYIEAHPDNHYVTLADNVLSPFNEYIHFTLNFRLIGLFLIFIGTYRIFMVEKPKSERHRRESSCLLPVWYRNILTFFLSVYISIYMDCRSFLYSDMDKTSM